MAVRRKEVAQSRVDMAAGSHVDGAKAVEESPRSFVAHSHGKQLRASAPSFTPASPKLMMEAQADSACVDDAACGRLVALGLADADGYEGGSSTSASTPARGDGLGGSLGRAIEAAVADFLYPSEQQGNEQSQRASDAAGVGQSSVVADRSSEAHDQVGDMKDCVHDDLTPPLIESIPSSVPCFSKVSAPIDTVHHRMEESYAPVAPVKARKLADVLIGQGVTTLMIRNIPAGVTQKRFLAELTRYGFGGSFDFVYLPCCFESKTSKGYGFINFISSEALGVFVNTWHTSRIFGHKSGEPVLNVSAAAVQGLSENVKKWSRGKRIRNPDLRPYIAPAEALNPDLAVPHATKLAGEGHKLVQVSARKSNKTFGVEPMLVPEDASGHLEGLTHPRSTTLSTEPMTVPRGGGRALTPPPGLSAPPGLEAPPVLSTLPGSPVPPALSLAPWWDVRATSGLDWTAAALPAAAAASLACLHSLGTAAHAYPFGFAEDSKSGLGPCAPEPLHSWCGDLSSGVVV